VLEQRREVVLLMDRMKKRRRSTMDHETVARVQAVVTAIPVGQVLSYSEVADRAGVRSARLVGRILAESNGLPWHRVIRADGTPTPHLAAEQTALLRAEGVRIMNGRVVF
jgi:methylated-DNA-protein-cysteine methyltransferase-like protein